MKEVTTARSPARRVLIVEDRYLIACELADELSRLGFEVLGPAPTVAQACELLGGETVDAALLDVNLDGELVFPVAALLEERGVPFIFLTGYDREVLPPPWRGRPSLAKPIETRALKAELEKALATPA
jgi:DNA-binding response OmpR family regulator